MAERACSARVERHRLYMSTYQKAYDPELFVVMRGLHHLAAHHETGADYLVFTDSQAAMRRI